MVQFKRDLATKPYAQQVEAVTPEYPEVQLAIAGTGSSTAVQMEGGGASNLYPTGQSPASRTEDELWDDCSPKFTLTGADGAPETDAQKTTRMAMAESALKQRFSPRLVSAILSNDRGQSPRPFTSLSAEEGLGLGGHAIQMHVIGMGVMTGLDSLAMRACLHIPKQCSGKASAFNSLADADTAVGAVIAASMAEPSAWKVARAAIVRGQKKYYTGAFGGGGASLQKVDPPIEQPYRVVDMPPYAHPSGRSGRPLYPGDPRLASLPKHITPQPDKPLTEPVALTEVLIRVLATADAPGGWYVNSAWPQ